MIPRSKYNYYIYSTVKNFDIDVFFLDTYQLMNHIQHANKQKNKHNGIVFVAY